jgi:hypothetical protein
MNYLYFSKIMCCSIVMRIDRSYRSDSETIILPRTNYFTRSTPLSMMSKVISENDYPQILSEL